MAEDLSTIIARMAQLQVPRVKGTMGVRPWTPQLYDGPHINATQTTEVTPDNYKRWAYNQIEAMNKGQERRLSSNTADYVIDRFRMLAGGESTFAQNQWIAAKRKMAEDNPLIAYSAGANLAMGGFGASLTGIFSPETASSMRKNQFATYGPAPGVAGFAGNLVGTAATLIPVLYTGSAGMMAGQAAAQGLGGSRTQTQEARETGAEISWGQEWGAAVSTGVVEGASGYLSAILLGRVGRSMAGLGPGTQAAFRNGGRSAAEVYLTRGLSAIPGMVAEAGEEGLTQIVTNAIDRAFSIDPDRGLLEGASEAALAGGLLAPFLGPVAARRSTQRLQAMEKGEVVPLGTTPQEGQLPVNTPQNVIPPDRQIDRRDFDAWDADPYGDDFGEGDLGSFTQPPPGPDLRSPEDVDTGRTDQFTSEGLLGVKPETVPPIGETFDADALGPDNLADNGLTGPARRLTRLGGWMRRKVTKGFGPWEPVNPPSRDDGGPPEIPSPDVPGGHQRHGFNLGDGVEDTISPISYLLDRVNTALGGRLKMFEASTAVKRVDSLRPFKMFARAKRRAFTKGAKKSGTTLKDLHMAFDNAVGNGDFARAERILRDYAPDAQTGEQLVNAMNTTRDTFARLRTEAVDAGLEVGFIKDYWPRNLRDHKQFVEDIRNEELQGIIDEKIQEVEDRKKRPLTPEEKTDLANKVIMGYGPQLPSRGIGSRNFKQRKIAVVPQEHQYLYHDSDYAAVNYISRTVEAIQAAKFFGRRGAITEPLEPGEIGLDMEDSIGAFVTRLMEAGRITPDQQSRVRELLMSRFRGGMQSPGKWTRRFRDIGYAVTIGNPISAITQLGDLGLAAVENGLWYTAQGVRLSLPKRFGGSGWTLEDVGIENISADFATTQQTATFVDKMMTWSGFKAVDALGKLTHVNASWLRFQKIARDTTTAEFKRFKTEWQPILQDEFDQTIRDLRSGQRTENVRMMLMAQVMKIQPIALSEMPKRYLDMRNGRVLYMLKTFTVKQTNYLRQRSLDKFAVPGQESEAMRELIRFAMLFGLAGVGADLLKKLLVGQPIETEDLSDIATENLIKVFGSSKFFMGQAKQQGPASAIVNFIGPPTGWLDDAAKDVMRLPSFATGEADIDDVKSYRNLPIIGKFLYQSYGGGAEWNARERRARRTKKRTAARQEAMQAVAEGDGARAAAIIRKYNEERPEGMKPITSKGLRQSMKNKARKEAQE